MGANASLPRHEIIIGDTSAIAPNQAGRTLVGGIIKDGFKLLVGAEARLWEISQYVMTGAEWPNKTSHLVPLVHSKRCTRDVSHGCLFDVKNDPSERNNVASSHPEIFKGLLSRMDEAQKTVYSPDRGHRDPQACIDVKTKYTGYWGPFVPT